MGNLLAFMKDVAEGLHSCGSYGTAHIYRSSLNALSAFHRGNSLPFEHVTGDFLKRFESHLRRRGCSWNTVSTYIRTLRAVYNRAVDQKLAAYVPHLFRHVYTGTKGDRKRALENADMAVVFDEGSSWSSLPPALARARGLFVLMFLLRGLPFVDLAYLRKSDLKGNVLTYRRRKTGRCLTVTLPAEAILLLERYRDQDSSSPYLFPLLHSAEGTAEAYREYQLALRHFNHQLAVLAEILGLGDKLSSYTARHTWATLAYYCEVHLGIISEAMGHSSICVTETYLKPFRNKKIDEANRKVITFVKGTFSCQ